MSITVGTFNLNNLFSRFNFELVAEIPGLKKGEVSLERIRTITSTLGTKKVTYKGAGLESKDAAARKMVADRIKQMDLDVLVAQEVEDIDTLRAFVREDLKDMYRHLILIEGNDPRLIDIAVLSKYPIGKVATWQHATHSKDPEERIFSRDLLQVQILTRNRQERLFTLFCNHLKSRYVPWQEDKQKGTEAANQKRKMQAETVAKIVDSQMRPDSAYIILGDMNDGVDSPYLAPFTASPELKLVNALTNPKETSPAPVKDTPPTTAWTSRFKPSGKPAEYYLFDQIWLSPVLAKKQTGAFIGRRKQLAGDGTDHDPSWVVLDM